MTAKTMVLAMVFSASFSGNAQEVSIPGIVKDNSVLKLVSKDFIFTEGPAVNKAGDVLFTDQPNDKIWKYSSDGDLTLFMDGSGRSNGLFFDKKGNLIACADEKNELWEISPNGKVTVLLRDYKGQRFNGPNDLWIDSRGGIYFTDPYYQRDYWTRTKPELAKQSVFYLPKGKQEAIELESQLVKPNGIIGSPDGKYLYVADIDDNKTYRYEIEKDGSLINRTLLINQGSDGMTVDEQGNIYLTGRGVTIYDKEGKRLGNIPIPSRWVGNICFAGKDRDILFITASESVYTLEMAVKGADR